MDGAGPLPEGWDVGRDVDGKPFFIDHNTKRTTWVDPRDRLGPYLPYSPRAGLH